jgi:uncharacterized protein YndB with AHSA1/START domain
MHIREVIEVAASPERSWAYVSDFSTAAEWDPGIVSSRKTSDGPVGFGSTFDVVAEFRGKQQPFVYRIADFVEGRRIVLEGEGEKARSVDTITFHPLDGGGTQIVYEADLTLKGFNRVAEPFLGGTVKEMGEKALAGLKAKLDAPA